ncbi:MAG: sigma-70 family RNA polymerase sigma factor [Myxococcales bacterium]|nr:sigma-70 family RNA polymerase sigma factor [Myxococcales bacterium]
MPTSDHELLAAWRAGDRQAGGRLLDRHFGTLRRFFKNKIGDDYEELVQRTLAGCVEGRERYRGEGHFRSYLLGIACNVLRDHLRQRYRDGRVDFGCTSMIDLGQPGPSTVAAGRREQVILLEALRRLPLDDQIALELRYWEQLNSTQIAQILGIPAATVRTRMRSARQLLRGHVDELARTPQELRSTLDGLERWAQGVRQQLG